MGRKALKFVHLLMVAFVSVDVIAVSLRNGDATTSDDEDLGETSGDGLTFDDLFKVINENYDGGLEDEGIDEEACAALLEVGVRCAPLTTTASEITSSTEGVTSTHKTTTVVTDSKVDSITTQEHTETSGEPEGAGIDEIGERKYLQSTLPSVSSREDSTILPLSTNRERTTIQVAIDNAKIVLPKTTARTETLVPVATTKAENLPPVDTTKTAVASTTTLKLLRVATTTTEKILPVVSTKTKLLPVTTTTAEKLLPVSASKMEKLRPVVTTKTEKLLPVATTTAEKVLPVATTKAVMFMKPATKPSPVSSKEHLTDSSKNIVTDKIRSKTSAVMTRLFGRHGATARSNPNSTGSLDSGGRGTTSSVATAATFTTKVPQLVIPDVTQDEFDTMDELPPVNGRTHIQLENRDDSFDQINSENTTSLPRSTTNKIRVADSNDKTIDHTSATTVARVPGHSEQTDVVVTSNIDTYPVSTTSPAHKAPAKNTGTPSVEPTNNVIRLPAVSNSTSTKTIRKATPSLGSPLSTAHTRGFTSNFTLLDLLLTTVTTSASAPPSGKKPSSEETDLSLASAGFPTTIIIICVVAAIIALVVIVVVIVMLRGRVNRSGKYQISSELNSVNGDESKVSNAPKVVKVQYSDSKA